MFRESIVAVVAMAVPVIVMPVGSVVILSSVVGIRIGSVVVRSLVISAVVPVIVRSLRVISTVAVVTRSRSISVPKQKWERKRNPETDLRLAEGAKAKR